MKIYSKENEYENKDFFESVNLISEDILKRYNDRIDKIEGGYIKLDYHEEPISIPDILQSCLKCSVAEDIRIDNKETIHNQNLIERYLNFYHFDYIENFENN